MPPAGSRKPKSEADGAMVERNQGKGAETPEDEGMRQAGQRALANDFGLEEHFPDKIPNALADGKEVKAGSFFDSRILLRMVPKRRQKPTAEAAASPAKSNFSAREKC